MEESQTIEYLDACNNKLAQLSKILFYMKMRGQVHSEEYVRVEKEVEIFSNYRDKLNARMNITSKL